MWNVETENCILAVSTELYQSRLHVIENHLLADLAWQREHHLTKARAVQIHKYGQTELEQNAVILALPPIAI